MAIGMNDLKNGLTIEYTNGLWRVLDFQHVKPGKGGAFVRSKLKNLRTGAVNEVLEISLNRQILQHVLCLIYMLKMMAVFSWMLKHMSKSICQMIKLRQL